MKLVLPLVYYGNASGIEIDYIKKRKSLVISGWYDHFVGIEPSELTLAQFFARLGITEKDCRLAFQKEATATKEGI